MPILNAASYVFDRFEKYWEGRRTQKNVALFLITAFLAGLLGIELKRQGLMPEILHGVTPTSHYYAISMAFTLLLVVEVIGLVIGLARSVSDAVGKQFEILSLILLRNSFKEIVHFSEPIRLPTMDALVPLLADGSGALIVFVVLGFYYRIQPHLPAAISYEERCRFIASKKLLSLILLAVFLALGAMSLWAFYTTGQGFDPFEVFYTILIFSDILLILISLEYLPSFPYIFRNSGFALATLLIRLALAAPPIYSSAIAVIAVLYAMGVTLAFGYFAKEYAVAGYKTTPSDNA